MNLKYVLLVYNLSIKHTEYIALMHASKPTRQNFHSYPHPILQVLAFTFSGGLFCFCKCIKLLLITMQEKPPSYIGRTKGNLEKNSDHRAKTLERRGLKWKESLKTVFTEGHGLQSYAPAGAKWMSKQVIDYNVGETSFIHRLLHVYSNPLLLCNYPSDPLKIQYRGLQKYFVLTVIQSTRKKTPHIVKK